MEVGGSWREHRLTSRILRALVVVLPPAVATAVGLTAGALLPQPSGGSAVIWWITVFAASMAALYGTERAARRLLSLSMLLRLSLIFPDRAPSRYSIALRSGSMRRLRHWAAGAGTGEQELGERLEGVLTLATALNTHDRRTRGHSERVRALTDLLAEEMGIRGEDADRLRWGALLHDVGKLSVPASILNKPGAPDEREWNVLRRHPAEGERIASGLAPFLGDGAAAISCHHERWEGGGYPNGIRAEQIPLTARIVAVTDSFETMTALRSYKRPMTPAEARAELINCAGKQFDPDVVRHFLTISLPRLNRTIGLLTWLAQIPFLGTMPRAAAQIAAGGTAAAAASPQLLAIGAVVLGAGAAPAAPSGHSLPEPDGAPIAMAQVVDEQPNAAGPVAIPGPNPEMPVGGVVPQSAPVDGSTTGDDKATPQQFPLGTGSSPALPGDASDAEDARPSDSEPGDSGAGAQDRSGRPADPGAPSEPGSQGNGGQSESAGSPARAGPSERAGVPGDPGQARPGDPGDQGQARPREDAGPPSGLGNQGEAESPVPGPPAGNGNQGGGGRGPS